MMRKSDEPAVESHRSFPRVSRSCPVQFRLLDSEAAADLVHDERQGGIMNNISGGGICFTHSEPMPPGQMLALEVDLPGFPTSVISMGRVVWCRPSSDGSTNHDIGVEFWWVGWKDEKAQKQISDFITHALDED